MMTTDGGNGKNNRTIRTGMVVYPALQYMIRPSEQQQTGSANSALEFHFGIPEFERLFPRQFPKCGVLITIEGPLGTFKSTFGVNFIARALMGKKNASEQEKGKDALIIRFRDHIFEGFKDHILYRSHKDKGDDEYSCLREYTESKDAPLLKEIDKSSTIITKVFQKHSGAEGTSGGKPEYGTVIIATIKSGGIYPEKILDYLRQVFRGYMDPTSDNSKPPKYTISRVLIDDVGQIGVAYPLLRRSKIAGDSFLPSLVRFLRERDVHTVITGTTGDLASANEAVNQARALANTVVSCRIRDIFGDQYAVVSGEGLMTGPGTQPEAAGEVAPAVIRAWQEEEGGQKRRYFDLDFDHLTGLVGFQSGNVHRPGLSLHLFQDNKQIHGKYNGEIETLIRSAFAQTKKGAPQDRNSADPATQVIVSTFDSRESESLHDSLRVLIDKPLDRTVICTLDEFWQTSAVAERSLYPLAEPEVMSDEFYLVRPNRIKEKDYVRPYYGNVLLLAYRNDLLTDQTLCEKPQNPKPASTNGTPHNASPSWTNVLELAKRIEAPPKLSSPTDPWLPFWFDRSASETLSCALMDALIVGSKQRSQLDIPTLHQLVKILREPNELTEFMTRLTNAGLTVTPDKTDQDQIESTVNTFLDAMSKDDADTTKRDACSKKVRNALYLQVCLNKLQTRRSDIIKKDVLGQVNDMLDSIGKDQLAAIDRKRNNEATSGDQTIELNCLTELAALSDLFFLAKPRRADASPSTPCPSVTPSNYERELPPNCGVYLCWYSQLRDLIRNNPGIEKDLQVAALPAGGFSGDWFVGIVKGSVSLSLGKQVIDILSDKKEEYKRFSRGVGLPTRSSFYSVSNKKPGDLGPYPNFTAWSYSPDVRLNQILEIHHSAFSRAHIPGYEKFRSALSTICRHLTPLDGRDSPPDAATIKANVIRLSEQIKLLAP